MTMTKDEQDAVVSLLQPLERADLQDVLRFAILRNVSRYADRKPITAAEWDRLTSLQKRVILWQVRIMAGGAKAARYIRTLTGKAG